MRKALIACLCLLLISIAAKSQYIISIAGNDTCGFYGDGGPASSASLKLPTGLCRDHAGNLYIGGDGALVRKINIATGVITTFAGGGTSTAENVPATTALVGRANGVCLNSAQTHLYICAYSIVRKVSLSTGLITTVAGMTTNGYSGDGGPATAAQLKFPFDVAIDSAENVYIADQYNCRIRKVDAATGIITTYAGNGLPGYSGDGGPATAARINYSKGLWVDKAGNLLIADIGNHRIRKVNRSTGIITTIAGTGVAAHSGDGGPATDAQLTYPARMILDDSDNMYIAEGSWIRKVNTATGIITTIAGTGAGSGPWGDGGPATAARMGPWGMALDTCGNMFLADEGSCHIRVITPTIPAVFCWSSLTTTSIAAASQTNISLWPNPAKGDIVNVLLSAADNIPVHVIIANVMGQQIYETTTETNKPIEIALKAPPGLYLLTAVSAEGMWVRQFIID